MLSGGHRIGSPAGLVDPNRQIPGPEKEKSMLTFIVTLLIVGLIAGALARLLVPGRQNMSIAMTVVVGVIGSFVGGFLGYVLFHHDVQNGALQTSGIIGSVIGAIIVLLIMTRAGHSRRRGIL
jgi:uncharacterized membrane protein YeaQ/YmgE (transglycosylase-associated protein family)